MTFPRALDEHLAALQRKDAAGFGATLGDDVATVDGRGNLTRGTAAVLQAHVEWFAAAEPWTFDYSVVFTRVFGSAALALIDVTYRPAPDVVASRFVLSLVFERNAMDEWKFVYDQNTPLRDHPG